MKIEAKKEADSRRRSANLTGGGPPPTSLSNSTETVLALLGNSIQPLENPDDPPSPLGSVAEVNADLNTSVCSNLETPECQQADVFNPEISSDALFGGDADDQVRLEEQLPNQQQKTNKRKKKSQDQEQCDLQCQLLREAIKTEKLRQEAEKCRAEAERCRAEREKLKKFMMLQECRDKGYVLPDDF